MGVIPFNFGVLTIHYCVALCRSVTLCRSVALYFSTTVTIVVLNVENEISSYITLTIVPLRVVLTRCTMVSVTTTPHHQGSTLRWDQETLCSSTLY